MRGQKKKNQRKWENSEEYLKSRKEKEYLDKYKNIAGEYLEDWEFIELFQKYNYEDEQISKELNKIILGDEFKWKEIKNGKPVTARSTDQIRKRKKYYRPEKSYPSYDKSEEEINEQNNKRKGKGSYHIYYVSKKPKRPFQKCYEVPSDYHAPYNVQDNVQDNQNNNNGDNNNNNSSNNAKNNISENSEKENLMPKNLDNLDENNKKNIKKNLGMNKKEETKNNEDKNENDDEDEQKKIILLKGKVFNSLKRIKTNTDIKKKDSIKSIGIYNNKENNEDNNRTPGPEINLAQDPKKRKELQKKYFRDFVGHMKHYSKKTENNIKRTSSKDSETSDDRSPETIKRKKRNNIPTSSTIIQKKKIIINNNSGINRNLRKAYEVAQNEIEFESKVANVSINSCYDNPMREQYLKIINEKRKQNPGKIVEFIIPQFNNPYVQPYLSPYQYNPYINQNMYMYPQQYPMERSMVNQPMNVPLNPQMNMQLNPQLNMQLNPKINQPMNYQVNHQVNQQINSPINSPVNSQLSLQMSPLINQNINYKNNYIDVNNPQLLSPQSNNSPNPGLINNNSSDN